MTNKTIQKKLSKYCKESLEENKLIGNKGYNLMRIYTNSTIMRTLVILIK